MNLLKSLVKVSGITLVSRILGFARDTLIARLFGAGPATDAFFVAFKLPNLLRRLFSEGAFAQAFVPLLGEYRHTRSLEDARGFIARVSALLGTLLTLLSALAMLGAPLLVWIMAPGFAREPKQFELTVDLLRITFPYILLISLSSLAGSVLNSWGRFSIAAFTPALLNLTFIGFALWLTPVFHPAISTLAWATVAGGLIQLFWPLLPLYRMSLLAPPRLDWRDSEVLRTLRQMGPAVFGVSVSQIALLLNSTFASFLAQGSVSWMYYADRLMEFPTGVLGAALGTILLPSLSRHATLRETGRYSALLDWGLRLSLLLSLPASLGLGLLAGPLTRTLFMYGHFTAFDASMTQRALIAYATGLTGLILIKVLAPGFYARQNVRTPVRIAMLSLAVTLAMNLVLVFPLKHAGLALSIGLGAALNAALLLGSLMQSGAYRPAPGWKGFITRIGAALTMLALVLITLQYTLPIDWTARASLRVAWLTVLVAAGAASYFATLFALGMRVRDFSHREAD